MELWTPILITIGLGPTFYGENGGTLGMVPFIIDHIHLASRGYSLAPNPLSFQAPTGVFVSQLEALHAKGFSTIFPMNLVLFIPVFVHEKTFAFQHGR